MVLCLRERFWCGSVQGAGVTGGATGGVPICEIALNGMSFPPIDSIAMPSLILTPSTLPQVSACVSAKLFTYTEGREPVRADTCALEAASKGFAAGGNDFTEMLKGLVTEPTFRLRRAAGLLDGQRGVGQAEVAEILPQNTCARDAGPAQSPR